MLRADGPQCTRQRTGPRREHYPIDFHLKKNTLRLLIHCVLSYLMCTSFHFPVELAMIMDRLYGGVCYAGIDTDPELKYPKGAGRVAFSNQQSYIAAISARFVQLQHGDIDKRVSCILENHLSPVISC